MKQFIKSIARKVIPENIRSTFYRLTPKIENYNTYLLKQSKPIENLYPIDAKFTIKQININDSDKLIRVYGGSNTFERDILPRLKNPAWVGLAVIDSTNDDICYVSWVITENIDFINDFKIKMNKNQFFLRHGYCVPEYRHQGLHTRMEQERINYCIRNGVNEIFIQIGSHNEKGKASVINNGYVFYQKNYILRIPGFGIYKEFFSAIKAPFRSLIKF